MFVLNGSLAIGSQCYHELPRCGAARVSVPQFGLPLAGLDPPGSPSPLPKSARTTSARPIHVSAFARAGDDFYATPSWVTEALPSARFNSSSIRLNTATLAILAIFPIVGRIISLAGC
jgi:hypothetical protein